MRLSLLRLSLLRGSVVGGRWVPVLSVPVMAVSKKNNSMRSTPHEYQFVLKTCCSTSVCLNTHTHTSTNMNSVWGYARVRRAGGWRKDEGRRRCFNDSQCSTRAPVATEKHTAPLSQAIITSNLAPQPRHCQHTRRTGNFAADRHRSA